MSRVRRPHLPGAVFHITSRIQGHRPLLGDALQPQVLGILEDTLTGVDVRLPAFAVMPNHLHLVLQQGFVPLGRVLQPVLRRIALLVQRVHAMEGHVFERRFNHRTISDPEYLRNAIVYTHLNPVRAGLCDGPAEYPWTSHHSYALEESPGCYSPRLAKLITTANALPLFASTQPRTREQMNSDYRIYADWRMAMDRWSRAKDRAMSEPPPPCPLTFGGDRHWSQHFSRPFRTGHAATIESRIGMPSPVPDLRDIALAVLGELAPDAEIDEVRSKFGGRKLAAVRRAMIARMVTAGYRGVQIASYLRIHESYVSRIHTTRRRLLAERIGSL